MNIAKAYEMLISGQGSRRSASQAAAGGHFHGAQEPWLSAGIYRVVSRTADLIDRISSRTTPRH